MLRWPIIFTRSIFCKEISNLPFNFLMKILYLAHTCTLAPSVRLLTRPRYKCNREIWGHGTSWCRDEVASVLFYFIVKKQCTVNVASCVGQKLLVVCILWKIDYRCLHFTMYSTVRNLQYTT